jgi:HEAT repeat protein
MDDPLQALREARTMAGRAEATRAIAANASALRDELARALGMRNDTFRIDVLNAVGASRDPSLAPLVETLIDARPDPRVLRIAAIALGNLGGPRAFDRLASLLQHRDATARAGAIRGLAILGDGRAVDLLRRLLGDGGKPAPIGAGAIEGPVTVGSEAARALRELTRGEA